MDRRQVLPSGPDHGRDDAGGVWIVTGWVLGGLVYLGVVLAWRAGFTGAVPFVVIPAVLVFMVGAGNLLSGKRPGRPGPRFNRPEPVPLTTFRRDGGVPADSGGGAAAGDGRAPETGAGPGPPGSGR